MLVPMKVPAQAQVQGQSEADLDKLDRMQRQMNLLQQQIQSLKGEIAQAKKKPVERDNAYAASPPPAAKLPPPPAAPTAVAKMTPGYRPSICAIEGIPGMFTKTGTPYIDNLNCIALTSRLHLDVGGYDYRPNAPFDVHHPTVDWTVPQNLDSGVNARRARIGVIGTFEADWVYSLIYDLGGSSDGFGSSITGCVASSTITTPRAALSVAHAESDCCREASRPESRPPI